VAFLPGGILLRHFTSRLHEVAHEVAGTSRLTKWLAPLSAGALAGGAIHSGSDVEQAPDQELDDEAIRRKVGLRLFPPILAPSLHVEIPAMQLA
jgi:hypothetical protein